MLRTHFLIGLTLLTAMMSSARGAGTDEIYVDQGTDWTTTARADFYVRDQGSRLITLSWMLALKQRNGHPFLADGLSRYGYLPNPGNKAGLPVGFHASGPEGLQIVGMTCSACHTRQIEVAGLSYRVDGGPALADFYAFLGDLDKAIGDVTASDANVCSICGGCSADRDTGRGRRRGPAATGRRVVCTVSHDHVSRTAQQWLGAWASGCCWNDFQPRIRSRYRPAP
ncbi:hypothetical protein ACVW0J_009534 [Bradyrhizobium sp. i1.7.7]